MTNRVPDPEWGTIPYRMSNRGPGLLGDEDGLPSFSRLQRRLVTQRPTRVHQRTLPARLWLFDVLHLDGRDLTDLPYVTRRAMLADLVPQRGATLAVAPSWGGEEAAALLESAVELGIEGTLCASSRTVRCPKTSTVEARRLGLEDCVRGFARGQASAACADRGCDRN